MEGITYSPEMKAMVKLPDIAKPSALTEEPVCAIQLWGRELLDKFMSNISIPAYSGQETLIQFAFPSKTTAQYKHMKPLQIK